MPSHTRITQLEKVHRVYSVGHTPILLPGLEDGSAPERLHMQLRHHSLVNMLQAQTVSDGVRHCVHVPLKYLITPVQITQGNQAPELVTRQFQSECFTPNSVTLSLKIWTPAAPL